MQKEKFIVKCQGCWYHHVCKDLFLKGYPLLLLFLMIRLDLGEVLKDLSKHLVL